MKHEILNETAMLASLSAGALWSYITGDTFLAAAVGALFAVYFQIVSGREKKRLKAIDIAAFLIMSIGVGIIAGPYFADQMPDGQGKVGVGSFICAFIGVRSLQNLNQVNWNPVKFAVSFIEALGFKKK